LARLRRYSRQACLNEQDIHGPLPYRPYRDGAVCFHTDEITGQRNNFRRVFSCKCVPFCGRLAEGEMMQLAVIFAVCAAAAVAFHIKGIKERLKAPSKNETIMLVSSALACSGYMVLKSKGYGPLAAALSAVYFYVFNYTYGGKEKELAVVEALFLLALLSTLLAPNPSLRPLILPVSFLVVIITGPAFYKTTAGRSANISTVFFTLFWHVLLVYEFFFSGLPHPAAGLGCAALTAVFYNFEPQKGVDYYMEEKRLERMLAAGLPAVFLQCFILVFILKNPLF
jgi:hypothetical protein